MKRGVPGGFGVLVIGLFSACASSLGEQEASPAGSMPVPPLSSLLARPIGLLKGQGTLHREVSTQSRTAQEFYDQGLALLASYSWVDAARSFHQALREDPALAVAMAGLARAERGLGETVPARRSLRAAELAAAAPTVAESDRRWVELAVLQQWAIDAPEGEAERRAREYRRGVEAYLRSYPRDPDGFVRRGDADSGPAGQGQTGGEGSLRWYRAAISLAPDHLAAHHHLAHSLENLGRPAEGLEHALRFAALAPAAPHAQHLVGHLLPPLGRWREAVEWFEKADRLHRRRFERERLAPETDWHFGHNLNLLAAARWQLSKTTEAEALWHQAFALEEHGPRAGALCLPWLELMLLQGQEDLAREDARRCARRGAPVERAIGRAVEGEVMVARSALRAARELLVESEAALSEAWERADSLPAAGVALEAAVRTVRSLEAKIALAEDDGAAGELRLDELARGLAAQRDFDAWSTGLLRLLELRRYAARHGRSDLADRIASRITVTLDGGAPR